ncbi:hypothetical protein PLICRDRAFT_36073 [Plicaturopsis crispa FD-325 SS-3]|nr:hypothetical protein PLICRDRAFT_36073 [Plicaturopsis crispa FD-325 SS-3]
MPPPLPTSLSPHICVLQSPDLTELLVKSQLPPLPQILQSFSPLAQVTARTTSLTSVPHASFALRFSDLLEIENACKEDEEQRAVRTIDWIGARVAKRSGKWVEDMEKTDGRYALRTPWWDEIRRCAEGDHVPSKVEGWNHPVAIILAVSTTAPNPLQAITALHSRIPDFPPWVDSTHIRCTLIIHPRDSPLSNEEAGALFNAVKKQFGLHSYLIPLELPPSPTPVPVPALVPRLPPPSPEYDPPEVPFGIPSTPMPATPLHTVPPHPDTGATSTVPLATLKMCEQDIQQTARFTREFVVMSLLPWMEKCVVEWNENYSSTRRLPSRLFSSTRRLFGTASPPPVTANSATHAPTRSHTYNGSQGSITGAGGLAGPPPQQRRLAEFATILGDFKLAVSVWESLRKEGKGGSEILPMLLSPAPTIPLHVSHALSTIHPPTPELPAYAQLRALVYAVRWELGIGSGDFLSSVLEGERWLVWAAGNAEEPPSALLLAHAALLSARKQAHRRAALWYLFAANRLEKCGIKPLTMYFLRRAHELYKSGPEKSLSPSFWDSEGKVSADALGFEDIMPGIEHPLGRLLYTTGEVAEAVRLFLGLLKRSQQITLDNYQSPNINGYANGEPKSVSTTDRVFLEDFRVALQHLKDTAEGAVDTSDLKLPFTLCLVRPTKIRLPRGHLDSEEAEWETREDDWRAFWKSRGKETLEKSGKAAVDETFWVDVVLRNPLDAEINLANLTLAVKERSSENFDSAREFVEVENLNEITLGAGETRTIPIAIKSTRPASLTITAVSYEFLALLPLSEPLAIRGRRLQETALQRQSVMYAPDVLMNVEVEEASQRLLIDFVDDERLELAQGECKQLRLWISNEGTRNIGETWLVAGVADEVWVDHSTQDPSSSTVDTPSTTEIFHSDNRLAPRQPHHVPLSLPPGDSTQVPITIHAGNLGEHALRILFVYREKDGQSFRSVRLTRHYAVRPIFEVSARSQPSRSLEHLFLINLELENVTFSSGVEVSQVTVVSPTWTCTSVAENAIGTIPPYQTGRIFFGANRWNGGSGADQTLEFVTRKLGDVLYGNVVDPLEPPPIELLCTHTSKKRPVRSVNDAATRHFIHSGRRNYASSSVAHLHPHIPSVSYPTIFPLYNPASVDVVVFWEIPSQRRSGHLLVPGITLGAGHAALKETIEAAENAKVKRSMYAETQREKMEVLESIRNSEWNREMNPIVVTLQDQRPLEHDFSKGPCRLSTTFALRNYSLTHTSRFILKLPAGPTSASYPPSLDILPPRYCGRLTFRGTLQPSEVAIVHPELWITRPGTYALGGWRLETEVGEHSEVWRTRHRYAQASSPNDRSSVTVSDISARHGLPLVSPSL